MEPNRIDSFNSLMHVVDQWESIKTKQGAIDAEHPIFLKCTKNQVSLHASPKNIFSKIAMFFQRDKYDFLQHAQQLHAMYKDVQRVWTDYHSFSEQDVERINNFMTGYNRFLESVAQEKAKKLVKNTSKKKRDKGEFQKKLDAKQNEIIAYLRLDRLRTPRVFANMRYMMNEIPHNVEMQSLRKMLLAISIYPTVYHAEDSLAQVFNTSTSQEDFKKKCSSDQLVGMCVSLKKWGKDDGKELLRQVEVELLERNATDMFTGSMFSILPEDVRQGFEVRCLHAQKTSVEEVQKVVEDAIRTKETFQFFSAIPIEDVSIKEHFTHTINVLKANCVTSGQPLYAGDVCQKLLEELKNRFANSTQKTATTRYLENYRDPTVSSRYARVIQVEDPIRVLMQKTVGQEHTLDEIFQDTRFLGLTEELQKTFLDRLEVLHNEVKREEVIQLLQTAEVTASSCQFLHTISSLSKSLNSQKIFTAIEELTKNIEKRSAQNFEPVTLNAVRALIIPVLREDLSQQKNLEDIKTLLGTHDWDNYLGDTASYVKLVEHCGLQTAFIQEIINQQL